MFKILWEIFLINRQYYQGYLFWFMIYGSGWEFDKEMFNL